MGAQQVPEGRYGSRTRNRIRPWVRWVLFGVGILLLIGVSVVAYRNLGSKPIEGKQSAFAVVDDHSVNVTVELQRQQPERPAECVVRARSMDGNEVGRKELLMPPSQGTTQIPTVLRTSARPVTGEVYGCTYDVPPYMFHSVRPTG